MPDSETFDAFYARTVWSVTSQMHELAGDDSIADPAIREAYAKAYQQWYQVSASRDPEGWVLATAKDAYERRAEAAGFSGGPAEQAGDSGTWPGFFRPGKTDHSGEPGVDPDATVAPPGRPRAGGEGSSTGVPGATPAGWNNYPAADAMAGGPLAGYGAAGGAGPRGPADDPASWFGAARSASPTREIGYGGPGRYGSSTNGSGPDGLGSGPGGGWPAGNGLAGGGRGRPGGGGPSGLATRRNLIVAGVAVAALAIVGIAYSYAGRHNTPNPAASQNTTAQSPGKAQPHMLAAGRTGQLSDVPWSLVGPGWALAEVSTGAPNSAGQASVSSSYTTYLVDPEGGKYKIAATAGGPEPQLMAWSGNKQTALFNVGGNGSVTATSSYQLLNVRTGQLAPLQLPVGVVAMGFTRPDGLAILAVHQGPAEFRLQRYTLTGQLQASLAVLPRKGAETLPSDGCTIGCALSSPDGVYDVWGIAGDGMQVLGNAGGKATRVRVKDSGHPSSCVPITWWNDSTILAACAVADMPDDASRLWLIPDDGSTPSALTSAAAAGDGRIEGAWPAGQTTYVTSVISRQCPAAQGGPYGLGIMPLGQGSSGALDISGATNNVNTVVATYGHRLLVLAQTSCPGTSSLFWYDPSSGATPVLQAPSSQAGVIAAVPYGNGPTASSAGQ